MDSGANDNDSPVVKIIVGRARRVAAAPGDQVHILLVAPDDDSAVRAALEALQKQGYLEADLDQIGELQEAPDEEPHASAYQGALEGEIAIVTLR